MIAALPVNEPTWQQVERGTHRWELRHLGDEGVRATVWLEEGWWHWSVPGSGIPKRGVRKVFREATVEAEVAAKKGK